MRQSVSSCCNVQRSSGMHPWRLNRCWAGPTPSQAGKPSGYLFLWSSAFIHWSCPTTGMSSTTGSDMQVFSSAATFLVL